MKSKKEEIEDERSYLMDLNPRGHRSGIKDCPLCTQYDETIGSMKTNSSKGTLRGIVKHLESHKRKETRYIIAHRERVLKVERLLKNPKYRSHVTVKRDIRGIELKDSDL